MILSIEKKKFSEAIHIASRFIDHKNTTLPILSTILILAGDEGIRIRATNLEIGADIKLDGEIKTKGVVAVPALVLQQIAGSFAHIGNITLEYIGDSLSLVSETGKSLIKTLSYDDFPSVPFPEDSKNRFVLPGTTLKHLFMSAASCASPSTIRPELASLYLFIEGGTLTTVATDSFRLVEKKTPLASKGAQGKFLIPAKNALAIAQAVPNEDVIISFDEHQCAFISTMGMFVSRLTNAVYPDYRQIIPKESVVEASVLYRDFENAIKRTAVFSDSFHKLKLNFDPKKKSLVLFARNQEIGESSETLPAHTSGNPLDLSFNHRYLSAVLGLTSAESLSFTAAGVGRPLIIRGVGDTSLLYLVSPMNQ